MAGANLTDNNPAIADLSDPYRATKLAEQFSELYDNLWTDASEALEIPDEKECIQYLLNIALYVFQKKVFFIFNSFCYICYANIAMEKIS
jgi:hypothetical protein